MSKKSKKNLIQIKRQFDAALNFTEGKITKGEFEKKHAHGEKEKWGEMPYVACSQILFESFLKLLPIPQRLRAVKDTYDYSFNDIKKLGGFGGSIHQFFRHQHKYETPQNKEEFKELSQRARLAITLDVPLTYLIVEKPTMNDIKQYEGLEFKIEGEKISFNQITTLITRPTKRQIKAYRVENLIGNEILFKSLKDDYINMRIDSRASIYIIEFYLPTQLDITINTINRIAQHFKSNIYSLVLSRPLLRDSFKLSLVCTYLYKQNKQAKLYTDHVTQVLDGRQLYPYKLDFGDMENIMSQFRD